MYRHVMTLPTFAFAVGVVCLFGFQQVDAQQVAKKAKKPNVDLVICLDTSGSMNGLIESAKTKLWDIVNELAKGKPAPTLRIALLTYGSPSYGPETGFVNKDLDFTTDLDMVYQKLFALRTNGGTELVARVSKTALDDLDWVEDKRSLRLIFVCGNERADQDKQHSLAQVAKEAVKKNVIINTIYCRWNGAKKGEAETWSGLSALAEGRFVTIDQNKGTVVIATPVDKKLAELGQKMNKTYVWYGIDGKARMLNQLKQDANAVKLGTGVAATRATSKAGYLYRMEGACLVDRALADSKFDITKVAEKDLPEDLKKLTPKQRVKYLDTKKQERLSLQKEIAELSKQRDAFLREHNKKNLSKADQAFDDAIRATLQTQTKNVGIQLPK